ncbi:hypothetical protein MNBD_GAMMA08-1601 [hydrothermal vent metagenome]|uniref:Flagellar protein FliT n=1 Tax=hydrothermal vent metagenome TaxID=652676 RepID=A0A3B0XR83_9ZZZZ
MNAEKRHLQWESILKMTEDLQLLSATQNWQKMNDISTQRQARLARFFSVSVTDSEAEIVAQGIQKILKSDQLTKQVCRQHQKGISSEVQKINTGRQALKAYGVSRG